MNHLRQSFAAKYDAGQLTGITYAKGTATVGTLTYEYDAAGQRTRVGGSLARTGIPQVLTSASYNNANRQTAFGAQTLTYDDNGNLTSDGTNTYTWNARNQLAAISGPGLAASFSYDALGRRTSKTVNSSTTGFLYDGANIVQEQAGASPSANLLTGGTDQFFSRTDAGGTVTPLTDALGSVAGLTDASGAVQTSYSYEPFGRPARRGRPAATARSTRAAKTMARGCITIAIAIIRRRCNASSAKIPLACVAATSTFMLMLATIRSGIRTLRG